MDISKINKPKTCDLWLPNRCMLRCKMCFLWKDKDAELLFNDPNRLRSEEYKKLFYDLKDFADDSFSVSFGGGEPLLDSELMLGAVKICGELGFKTYFPTNGYLLDEKMAKRIKGSGVSSIGISLESVDKNIHDYIRGKEGSWDRIMKAIDYMADHCPGLFINILTVIMAKNLEGIIDLTKWVYGHPKIRGINFQAIQAPLNIPCPENWRELEGYADLWPKDTEKVCSVLDELCGLKRSHMEDKFKISNPIPQFEIFKLYFKEPGSFVKPSYCHLGDVVRVDCFGNVRTCDEMPPIGNIRENDIKSIWYSDKAEETRARIRGCKKNCYHLVNCYYG